MHWLWFIGLVTVSMGFYGGFNRMVANTLPPLQVWFVFTGVMFICATCCVLLWERQPIQQNIVDYWPAVIIGLAVTGINLGYVLAFANGAPVSLAPAIANVASMVILVLVGFWIFGEKLSLTQLAGLGLGVASIALIVKG